MKNFEMTTGLDISHKVLSILKKDKRLENIVVWIGCFTNCRESGLTYQVENKKNEFFTFCTYEHRNSDQLIINGKRGLVSHNGDLPYIEDSKWVYLASSECGEFSDCADKLTRLIVDWNKGKKIKSI